MSDDTRVWAQNRKTGSYWSLHGWMWLALGSILTVGGCDSTVIDAGKLAVARERCDYYHELIDSPMTDEYWYFLVDVYTGFRDDHVSFPDMISDNRAECDGLLYEDDCFSCFEALTLAVYDQ